MAGPAKRSNTHLKKIGSTISHIGEDLAPPLLTRIPEAPAILNEVGKEKWEEICELMIEEQMLTEWDLAALQLMALEWERYIGAVEECRTRGEYFTTSNGYEVKRPCSVTRDKAFANYSTLLKRFGGDVLARANMKRVKPQVEKSNPFSEL